MHSNPRKQQPRNHEHVQREESRQRRPANDRPAQHQVYQLRPHERHATGDRSADSQAPIRILVKPHHLPRKRHAQRQQQQHNANNPRKLARKFVCAKQKHLHHVNQHDGDHEVRSPSMQRAHIPTQRDIVIQKVQARPRLIRRRAIDQRQQNARHHLQDQQHRRRAAKHIPPARIVRRSGMRCGLADRLDEAKPMFQPLVHLDAPLF